MKKLFSTYQYKLAKSRDLLPLECYECNKTFHVEKRFIQKAINKKLDYNKFCNLKCKGKNKRKRIKLICSNCNKIFCRTACHMKPSKSGNYFCSKSCSAQYNNLHKKHGNRRSKLEKWLEQQLNEFYPNFEILYNDKSMINAELDIYFPSLKLAVEINGMFHYEPIFGESKLNQIKNNDQRKHQACHENNIEILWIDTSNMKYFKPQNAQPYLNIIIDIVEHKLSILSQNKSVQLTPRGGD